MLTNDDRKYILNELLRTILHISDKEYQKKIWINGEGPECDDFDETVCYFFDASDPILEDYTDYFITKNQYNVLMQFRNAFKAFSDEKYWPLDFIDTPEWGEIMKKAKEVLEAFSYQQKQ